MSSVYDTEFPLGFSIVSALTSISVKETILIGIKLPATVTVVEPDRMSEPATILYQSTVESEISPQQSIPASSP